MYIHIHTLAHTRAQMFFCKMPMCKSKQHSGQYQEKTFPWWWTCFIFTQSTMTFTRFLQLWRICSVTSTDKELYFTLFLNVSIHEWSRPSAQTVCLHTPLQSPFHLSLTLVWGSGWPCFSTSVPTPLSDVEFVLWSGPERKDSWSSGSTV